jgi:hypothetical protein
MKLDDCTVEIEHCRNCNNHNWCTQHNEKRYDDLGAAIEKRIRSCDIPIQSVVRNAFDRSDKSYPRVGSFEIVIVRHGAEDGASSRRPGSSKKRSQVRIFSKLKTGKWPTVEGVLDLLRFVAEDTEFNPDFEWYIKLFLGVHFAANWVSVH